MRHLRARNTASDQGHPKGSEEDGEGDHGYLFQHGPTLGSDRPVDLRVNTEISSPNLVHLRASTDSRTSECCRPLGVHPGDEKRAKWPASSVGAAWREPQFKGTRCTDHRTDATWIRRCIPLFVGVAGGVAASGISVGRMLRCIVPR